jgi:tetratricopeptide (TPR) repeat protein
MTADHRLVDYANHVLRGRGCELRGDWQAAQECYRSALATIPDWSLAHKALARACRYLEDPKLASFHARSAFAIDYDLPLASLLEAGRQKALFKVSRGKLRHDLDQLDYLVRTGRVAPETVQRYSGYHDMLALLEEADSGDKLYLLTPEVLRALGETIYRPLHLPPVDPVAEVFSPQVDFSEAEQRYARDNGILVIDGILGVQALQALRTLLLESTFWFDAKPRGYVGAYLDRGLSCELVYQIAFELRRAMPQIFDVHRLEEVWAYRYEHAGQGIAVHADAAAVNVNLWVTPDDANLAPERGGLVVYPVAPPADWSFERYNNIERRREILAFIEAAGVQPVRVPYRENRVVIFDSQYFHETDEFRFKDGYENRRTNLTMLYGAATHDPSLWMCRGWSAEKLPGKATA